MAAVLAAEPELHSAARMHVPHRTNCFEVSHPNGIITISWLYVTALCRIHSCRFETAQIITVVPSALQACAHDTLVRALFKLLFR